MKKTIISISLLATLLCAGDVNYSEGLSILADDVKVLNTTAMSSIDKLANSDTKLEEYSQKLDKYETQMSELMGDIQNNFASKDDALVAMDKVENLSSQSVVLAKTVAYLASHQGGNVSDSYSETLKSVSSTVLRLSDDIGTMADRILVMADNIGIMADRIVKTQEIQSANLNATTQLVQVAMGATQMQMNSSQSQGMQNSSSMSHSSSSAASGSMSAGAMPQR
ncbi:MAG: hypothetical protein COA39_002650 [Sulfurimonas sp.]|nr:hypothetical protein [Sulfurimonas sp.]